VRASIGLARAVPGEMSADEALRNADVAMYLAKSRGKGTVAHYESRLHAESLERLALRADLQRGIRDGELRLHFQPTIDLRLGGVAGFEALVRWEHPTRGLIPPLLFVPMAEESGLIRALGSWVLRAACAAAVHLNAARPSGSRPLPVAVNVGAQQLADPGFVNEVLQVLTDVGLHPSRLTLEITESVVLQDLSVVVSRLAALRDRGIRIAIDDFGTGYSSLAYLRNLPVDILKIDKSFIDHVTTEAQDAALTEGILAMSTGMNLTTVAEGVEVAAQAQWLSTAHCVYGQGFLWSRPVPLTDAIALLSGPLKPADLDATEATDGYRKLSITT
jgi:EAL domain-containing protein (putative c-di-GMP-specific phosphodiesterase class I)